MTGLLEFLLGFLGGVAIGWAPVNLCCWYCLYRRSFRSPFNWRVLVGPWVYCPWEQEREGGRR